MARTELEKNSNRFSWMPRQQGHAVARLCEQSLVLRLPDPLELSRQPDFVPGEHQIADLVSNACPPQRLDGDGMVMGNERLLQPVLALQKVAEPGPCLRIAGIQLDCPAQFGLGLRWHVL